LDKALVVWQDPVWATKEADLNANPKARNPNIHRRVDIIISPWRTVGCAVTGWTSGTTFQRDLRRYARKIRGWKFDSSGVRDRNTGEVVELEGPEGVNGSMVDAEKKVFEGFGLEYREPSERCTG
jgi:DNA polymerase IV